MYNTVIQNLLSIKDYPMLGFNLRSFSIKFYQNNID